MKSLILLAVATLIVGVGGGTGLAVLLAPDAAPDDSTGAHLAAPDSTATVVVEAAHGVSKVDSQPAQMPSDSAHATAAGKPVAAEKNVAAEAAPPTASPPVAPVQRPDSVHGDTLQRTQLRRISRIFAAMAPREAARVLQQLDNPDIISIVGALTEKQAAAVLMAMPPERAALISRGSLASKPGRTP
jgi:hypothetical protein